MPFDASPQTDTVADVLRRARALIDSPEKWCKGALYRDGARCVWGALDGIRTGEPTPFRKAEAGATYITRAIGGRNIASWNNAPERTHAEVLAAFDRAIKLAERGGR